MNEKNRNLMLIIGMFLCALVTIQSASAANIDSTRFLKMKEAAERGNTSAQYTLGICYFMGEGVEQDYREAVKWYRKAAEKGYADAQNSLGFMYFFGKGVDQDYTEGVKWIRKAAEQGNAESQFHLGFAYIRGDGVDRDYDEGVKWYHKAIEQKHAGAMNNMGHCYVMGFGVPQDDIEAYAWFLLAAKHGFKKANIHLKRLMNIMTQKEVLEAERKAEILDKQISSGRE